MAQLDEGDGLRIGETLKRTRTRQGLDMRTVEQRTKIRTKYLRALENEDWDVLPAAAYAKAFLRTYAGLLGLDADALVDEYRRQVESDLPSEHAYGLGEPVLGSRPRLGERDRNLAGVGTVAALVLVAVVGVLLGIGLLGGDDRDGRGGDRARAERLAEQRERKAAREREQRREQQAEQSAQQVALRLDLNSDVQVCLVGDSGQALVDSQVLTAGTEESFEAGSFDLRFPSGYDREQFDLFLGGERARVPETQGPTAFRLTPPAEIEQVTFPGLACP